MTGIITKENNSFHEIIDSFTVKEQSWLHENEARFIANRAGKMQYNPSCINAIYISSNMPRWSKDNLTSCIKGKKCGIKIFEVSLHNKKYKFGYKQIIQHYIE